MTPAELREQIPFLADVAYLDNASVVPAPKCVLDAMSRYAAECPLNYGVGEFPAARRAAALVDEARAKMASFINAEVPEEIIFTKNTTEAINTVASSGLWREGDEIIITSLEHQSNMMPWIRLANENGVKLSVAQAEPDGTVKPESVKALVTPRTRLINVTYVSNIYGTITPVDEIGEIAREAGALYMIDAAQAGGRLVMDVRKSGCDFMAICGRKSMMGPQGTGALYAKKELLEQMRPLTIGSRAGHVLDENTITLNKAPYKFEAGVLNTAGVIGLGVAAEMLAGIGLDKIFARNAETTQYMIDGLLSIPQAELYGGRDASKLAGVISWNVRGMDCAAVASKLGEQGVAVASGAQGALLAIRPLGIKGVVRSSVHYFTEKRDVDALVEGVRKILG